MALNRSNYALYFHPKPPSLEIGKELSRGAYGAVHSGRLNGKEVAIKRIHGLLLEAAREQGDLEKMLSDFRHECELLERVDHPHVVKFEGAFYDETTDEPILVMELMTENLRRYLQRNSGQLSRQKQLEICTSISCGLRFLHTRTPPIVHRDLTDKNVLLDANGVAKISDLGQSRLKTAEYFSTGQPGAILFMSPEAMQQPSHYNEKLDMFSLGVVMLEVATQQFPLVSMVGIGVTPELQRRKEDLSKLDWDHPLRPMIQSCLKDNPKERPDIITVLTQLLAVTEGDKIFQTSHILENQPTLHSERMPDLPIATCFATAVVIARNLYISGGVCHDLTSARVVHVYNLDKAIWTKLPPAPQYFNKAAAINNQLVLIGGYEASSQTISNMVSTWTGQGWQQDIPAMPTKRFAPGVTTYNTYAIVAGGMAEDNQTLLSSIDVLNTNTLQWFTPVHLQLPQPMYIMQITVGDTHICVASPYIAYAAITDTVTPSKRVWKLPVNTLTEVLMREDRNPHQWEENAPTPNVRSALLLNTSHPLAVGGHELGKSTPNITVYDPRSNEWSTVGQLLEPRTGCTVVSLSKHSFLVCGGASDPSDRNCLLNSVEVVSFV